MQLLIGEAFEIFAAFVPPVYDIFILYTNGLEMVCSVIHIPSQSLWYVCEKM